MDAASVIGAYQGLKAAKEILSAAFEAKVDAEAKPKVMDALQKLGDAQDTLFALRDELFSLQEANNKLKLQLAEATAWQARVDQYELTRTAGGAIVYRFKAEPEHYACPSCFNAKAIHILQPNRTSSGKYRCTGCTSEFPVEPQQKPQPIKYPSGSGEWG
jgi:transposase-like protein